MNPKDVGSVILALRLEKNISQSTLAKECNCVQSTIARIESGRRTPSVAMLDKIGKVLEVNLITLFGDYHKPQPIIGNKELIEQMHLFTRNANRIIKNLQEQNELLAKEIEIIKNKIEAN